MTDTNATTHPDAHVVVDRFPYYGMEFVTFILGGAIAGGLAYLLMPLPVVSASVAFVLGAVACFYMSWTRKESSKVTVTLANGYLTVQSNGKVGNGAVHAPEVISISTREVGARTCFILREDSNAKGEKVYANLPVRMLHDEVLYRMIGDLIAAHPDCAKAVKAEYAAIPAP